MQIINNFRVKTKLKTNYHVKFLIRLFLIISNNMIVLVNLFTV